MDSCVEDGLRVGPKNEIVKRAGLQNISRNCVIPRIDREAISLAAPSVSLGPGPGKLGAFVVQPVQRL